MREIHPFDTPRVLHRACKAGVRCRRGAPVFPSTHGPAPPRGPAESPARGMRRRALRRFVGACHGRRPRRRADIARNVRLAALRDVAARRSVAAVRGRAGRHGPCRQERRPPPNAVHRRLGRHLAAAASAACSRSRSRPTMPSRASSTRSPQRPTAPSRSGSITRRPAPMSPTRSSTRAEHPALGRQPQRRSAAVRARRPALYRRRRQRQERERPEHRRPARQDPAHEPARRRRPAGPPGDLRVRAAQSVAVLVRQPHGRPPDRRRRRHLVGGDRPAPGRTSRRRELRLDRSRARMPTVRPTAARPAHPADPRIRA